MEFTNSKAAWVLHKKFKAQNPIPGNLLLQPETFLLNFTVAFTETTSFAFVDKIERTVWTFLIEK